MSTDNFDRPRATRSSVLQALFLGAALLAASVAHASVTSAWSDTATHKESFSRVLVVGVSPDVDERCPFERALASKIKSETTVAIVSCDVMPLKEPLSRESIEAAIAAKNADAVLATSLVSKSWNVQDGGTHDTRGDGYYKATDWYPGPYGMPVVYGEFQTSASVTTVKGEAHITSKLYDARSAMVIYTLDSKVKNVDTRAEGLGEITAPIGKKLRKEGLIR